MLFTDLRGPLVETKGARDAIDADALLRHGVDWLSLDRCHYLCHYLFVSLSSYLSTYLSISFVYACIFQSIYPSPHVSIHVSTYICIYSSIYLVSLCLTLFPGPWGNCCTAAKPSHRFKTWCSHLTTLVPSVSGQRVISLLCVVFLSKMPHGPWVTAAASKT